MLPSEGSKKRRSLYLHVKWGPGCRFEEADGAGLDLIFRERWWCGQSWRKRLHALYCIHAVPYRINRGVSKSPRIFLRWSLHPVSRRIGVSGNPKGRRSAISDQQPQPGPYGKTGMRCLGPAIRCTVRSHKHYDGKEQSFELSILETETPFVQVPKCLGPTPSENVQERLGGALEWNPRDEGGWSLAKMEGDNPYSDGPTLCTERYGDRLTRATKSPPRAEKAKVLRDVEGGGACHDDTLEEELSVSYSTYQRQ